MLIHSHWRVLRIIAGNTLEWGLVFRHQVFPVSGLYLAKDICNFLWSRRKLSLVLVLVWLQVVPLGKFQTSLAI